MGKQGVLPLEAAVQPAWPRLVPHRRPTARRLALAPAGAIHATEWRYNERARLWQRDVSRDCHAQVGLGVADPTKWEARIGVYGGRPWRIAGGIFARATGFGDAQAAMAWVDRWIDQARRAQATPPGPNPMQGGSSCAATSTPQRIKASS